MNLNPICSSCKKPKAQYSCGICQEAICKSCGQFIGEETFSFLRKIPGELSHSIYCNHCYSDKVSDALAEYEVTMEKARDVIIFTKAETKKTGHLKRKEEPYRVEDCEDEDETVMRLAFFAVQDGHNCLLDVNITQRKIIIGSHKKTVFSATAIPISINPKDVRDY
jgi:hypothetical protein